MTTKLVSNISTEFLIFTDLADEQSIENTSR